MRRGAIVQARFEPVVGHEQGGIRPAVVLSDDSVTHHQRFPLILVVPLTSTLLLGPLYPTIQATETSGLKNPSTVLVDQLRAIDKLRIKRLYGQVEPEDLKGIERVLCRLLGIAH